MHIQLWMQTTLLANTPAQGKTLQLSLKRAAAGIDHYVNADKTVLIISTLIGSSLVLLDKFTDLGSSVLSTDTDINPGLRNA